MYKIFASLFWDFIRSRENQNIAWNIYKIRVYIPGNKNILDSDVPTSRSRINFLTSSIYVSYKAAKHGEDIENKYYLQ